jgi:PAS domain S-box-containing protein
MLLKRKNIKLLRWFIVRPKTSGVLSFLFVSIITILISLQQYKLVKELEQREMNNILNVVHHNIEESLKNYYTATLTLALTLNDEGIPKDFEYVSKQLIKSNNTISALELVPKGIIKYVYPIKGNEAAIGLNILTTENLRVETLKSISNQKMYFAGPLKLKQGGIGIVGRLPIYKKKSFWGFSAVIIKLDQLLKASQIDLLSKSKFDFQISKYNTTTKKEEFFLPQKTELTNSNFVTTLITDGEWKLYLIDKESNNSLITLIISTLLGTLLAMTFGFLTVLVLKKQAELQVIVEKQARNLIDSEIKFKTIFDQAAIGMANVDVTSGVFLEINNKFCSLLGYTQEEMRGRNFQSITHPDDLENDLKNVKKIENGNITEYSMEKRYFTKDGKTIWVNLSVTPLLDQNKKQLSTISIAEDITLRKQNEALVKKSENHFKSLFDDSPLPMREEDFSMVKNRLEELNLMNKNKDQVKDYLINNPKIVHQIHSLIEIINVNKACLKLYRVDNKEELLKTKSSLFSPDSLNDFTDQLVVITQNVNQFVIDSVIKNAANENRYINLSWNVVRGYEKSLDRIIVSNEDITNRKIAEKIILDSQQRIQSLINTVDGIVWECSPDTLQFTFISKKVEEILGYTSDEWLSSPNFWQDHMYEEDRVHTLQYCTDQTAKNVDHDFEYRMIAKDGTIVWLRDIVSLITENGKVESLRGIMIDITKTKEIENQLNKSFHLVTEQNKRLLNFSYIVSHNLRSHTSNITSIIDIIETADSKDEIEQMVQLLKTVSYSLNETMLNLNQVVNIQTNIGLITESLNLKQYINNTLTILSDQITAKEVEIITSVPDDVHINYNPAYLESILHNLVSNAIRYSSIDKKPIINISYQEEGENKILQVSDNGIGIDLECNAHKIFGMYKTFTNNKDSKGIGLFITKNQIEAMGGYITVESELNKGTTFKISIV